MFLKYDDDYLRFRRENSTLGFISLYRKCDSSSWSNVDLRFVVKKSKLNEEQHLHVDFPQSGRCLVSKFVLSALFVFFRRRRWTRPPSWASWLVWVARHLSARPADRWKFVAADGDVLALRYCCCWKRSFRGGDGGCRLSPKRPSCHRF